LDGRYSIEPLTEYEQAALDYLHGQLEAEYASQMLECKPNSLAVHWRGVEHRSGEVSGRMEQLYREFSANHQGIGKLQLLPFDGGVEFRVGDVHKGDAVRKMMNAMPENTFAAFLGDDTTDEDAFDILRSQDYEERTLAVLVRSEPRASFADIWLSTPDELLRFLDEWISATALAMDTL
jgi:trehalose-phosphatase